MERPAGRQLAPSQANPVRVDAQPAPSLHHRSAASAAGELVIGGARQRGDHTSRSRPHTNEIGSAALSRSIVPSKAAYLTTVSIPAGLLDDDPGVRPKLHVFAGSKAPWWEITDGLPQHEKWVPGFAPKSKK